MLRGDLSNTVTPRLLVVFEGLVAYLSAGNVASYNELGSLGDWPAALQCWDLSPLALTKISDLVTRRDIKVEVVSFAVPPEGAASLADRFDEESVPVSRVVSSTPERTARRLAYAPDIARVYCPDPRHALMCGSKGFHVTSVHQLGR